MAGKSKSFAKKDLMLKVAFILYIISVAAFLVMLYDSISASGTIFRIGLRAADFWANTLRIVADIMILAGFWKKRHNSLMMWGFLLNIIPQALDLLIHFREMKDSVIPSLAFVATIFLIFFYTMLTAIVVSGSSRDNTYLLAKINVLVCVLFWMISDLSNLAFYGPEGAYTAVFLTVDFTQMITLGIWGVLFTDMLKQKE